MNMDFVRAAVDSALDTSHFFVDDSGRLRIEHAVDEGVAFELFRGHLLEPGQTTIRKRFESWNVFVDRDVREAADVPLISMNWDRDASRLFVVRRILTRGFKAYEDTPGVILSRPVEKWVRELVGTIELDRTHSARLAMEVGTYLLLAVIGTSRLPITSLESPLPAFSLGKLGYFPSFTRAGGGWWRDPTEMLSAALESNLNPRELGKALEASLRAASQVEVAQVARLLAAYGTSDPLGRQRVGQLVAALFQNLALSPYTAFVDRLMAVLLELDRADAAPAGELADIIGGMLAHLCRHLTAFDLTTFHNFGANYPDALFLDALLKTYLTLVEGHIEWFTDSPDDAEPARRVKRRRRRALRQACMARKHYEGHRVPDAPTSQGENLRVLPSPFGTVPQQQITHASKRRRTLYADEPTDGILSPTGGEVLRASMADLHMPAELLELGMATFLDRPLGIAKQPGEADRTPLVSYTAFSRSIARGRLAEIERAGWISAESRQSHLAAVERLNAGGLAVGSLALVERPGVVSLADARKAAHDFSILRTTRSSFVALVEMYDWPLDLPACNELFSRASAGTPAARHVGTIIQHAPAPEPRAMPTVRFYDDRCRLRIELGFAAAPDGTVRYVERGGVELPDRLHVLRAWERAAGSDKLVERDLRAADLWIVPGEAWQVEKVGVPPP